MRRGIILYVIIFIFFGSVCALAQNPFLPGGEKEEREKVDEEINEVIKAPSFLKTVPRFVIDWQKKLRAEMTSFGRDINDNPLGKSFWMFLIFSFAYGVIHALGPGHGKLVVTSYFLSRPGNSLQGLLMGNLIAFVHVASAVVIILVLFFILKTTGISSFETTSPSLQKISYSMLMLIGFYFFGKTTYELKSGRLKGESVSELPAENKNLIATAIATGIIPCPGAAIILSFSIIVNILPQGLIAMLFIALGMGLTTSLVAVLTIISRKTVFLITKRGSNAFVITYAVISFTGSLAIIAISSLLLLEHL